MRGSASHRWSTRREIDAQDPSERPEKVQRRPEKCNSQIPRQPNWRWSCGVSNRSDVVRASISNWRFALFLVPHDSLRSPPSRPISLLAFLPLVLRSTLEDRPGLSLHQDWPRPAGLESIYSVHPPPPFLPPPPPPSTPWSGCLCRSGSARTCPRGALARPRDRAGVPVPRVARTPNPCSSR